jgi:hypothetical protein
MTMAVWSNNCEPIQSGNGAQGAIEPLPPAGTIPAIIDHEKRLGGPDRGDCPAGPIHRCLSQSLGI